MTVMQKEIETTSNFISQLGYRAGFGLCDMPPELEPYFNRAMTSLIAANEEKRKMQEETFQQMPWLRKLSEK